MRFFSIFFLCSGYSFANTFNKQFLEIYWCMFTEFCKFISVNFETFKIILHKDSNITNIFIFCMRMNSILLIFYKVLLHTSEESVHIC